MGTDKAAALFRMVSSLYWTIAHTIIFTVILAICNTDPGIVDLTDITDNPREIVSWSELALVQNPYILNILLVFTLCLGWGSLVLDVITAFVKNYYRSRDRDTEDHEISFWDGAILLEGLKYRKEDAENVTINTHQSEDEKRNTCDMFLLNFVKCFSTIFD